jgi:hypothetical protein
MASLVRDIHEKDPSKQYIIGGQGIAEFRWGSRAQALRLNHSTDWSVRCAELLRENGRPGARACDSGDNIVAVEGINSTPAEQALLSLVDTESVLRQCPPVKRGSAGFYTQLNVFFEGSWHNENIGPSRTENEALRRLFSDDRPLVVAYVRTLPLANAPEEVSAATQIDLSQATAFSMKEYMLIPPKELQVGGRYFTDAFFRQRVNLTLQARKDADARRKRELEETL